MKLLTRFILMVCLLTLPVVMFAQDSELTELEEQLLNTVTSQQQTTMVIIAGLVGIFMLAVTIIMIVFGDRLYKSIPEPILSSGVSGAKRVGAVLNEFDNRVDLAYNADKLAAEFWQNVTIPQLEEALRRKRDETGKTG